MKLEFKETCPEFSAEALKSMRLGKRTRRFILYPLLLVSGCHMLLTGSPVPTWHLEKLNSPVSVKRVEPGGLVLADGHTQKLPLVKRLPADDPLMLEAIKSGVEITDDGEVVGLLWVRPICGNDPCHWIRRRVNLALLAAILVPNNFDETKVPADVLAQLQEEDRVYFSEGRPRIYKGHISGYDFAKMYRVQNVLEHPWKPVEKEERWQWTFPATGLSDD
jgi:hypothetical protein